jgi:hypothetical protein
MARKLLITPVLGNCRSIVKGAIFAAALLASMYLQAQEKSEGEDWVNPEHTPEKFLDFKNGWFVGLAGGPTLHYGDVALYNYWPKFKDYDQSIAGGFSLFGGKKIIYGLAAEIELSKGKLMGQKIADKLYNRYFRADYMDASLSVKYNLTQQLFRKSHYSKIVSRTSLFLTAGAGQTFFRSRLYKQAYNGQWYLEKAIGYNTTGVDSAGITSAGGLVTTKKGMVNSLMVPVGGKINYKINHRTDVTMDVRYVTVFSDEIDGWVRSWSHKDRYLFIGIGFTLNIGKKDDEDLPKDKRFIKDKDEKAASSSDPEIPQIPLPGKSSGKKSKSDRELELKLKMYELQLMIFELQYLMVN